jgi:hypothetical protein
MASNEAKKQPDGGKKLTHDQAWGNFGQKPKESGWTKAMHVLFPISNFDKGGRVKKTGVYKLKKGERVLTVAQQKSVGLKHGKKKTTSRKRVAAKG